MRDNDFWLMVRREAEKAVSCYAQGVIEVQALTELMVHEWETQETVEIYPATKALARMAQRLCSRALYEAWRSPDAGVRNRAFEAMRCYLSALLHGRSASLCQSNIHAADDILSQTLETLHLLLTRNGERAGPDEPCTFLKWIETILRRKVYAYLKTYEADISISLDEQVALTEGEQWEDEGNPDPLSHLLREELQQALTEAISSLRNPNYKLVLTYNFLEGMDDGELALRLNAPIDRVYLWKHRALNALRKNQKVMQELRLLASI